MNSFTFFSSKRPQYQTVFVFLLLSICFFLLQNFYKKTAVKGSKESSCRLLDFESLFNQKDVPKSDYHISSHIVQTDDGYKLKIFRVHLTPIALSKLPKKLQKNSGKKLLVVHEFAGSSDGAFFNTYQNAYGFHQVDLGFDVWVANNRGNKYSNIEQNDMPHDKFYDYSFEEMGVYDLPAMYRHIFKTANGGSDKIIVFGYSQGTSEIFAGLLDERSGKYLTEKTEKVIAIAPIVYLNHQNSWFYYTLAIALLKNGLFTVQSSFLGFYQSLPSVCRAKVNWAILIQEACLSNWITKALCSRMIPGIVMDSKTDQLIENFQKASEYYPSGSSIKSTVHLAQMMLVPKDKYVFQRFDYGAQKNVVKYGDEYNGEIPTWDITKIQTNVVILNGTKDQMANKIDTMALYERLPENRRKIYWVENWSHITWNFATNAAPFREIVEKELQ